jgi:hypothetical protein
VVTTLCLDFALFSKSKKKKKTGEGEEGSLDLSRIEGDIVRNLQAWIFRASRGGFKYNYEMYRYGARISLSMDYIKAWITQKHGFTTAWVYNSMVFTTA